MKTRSTFFTMFMMLALLVSLVFQTAPAQAAGAGIDQDFRHSAAPGWTLDGNAGLTGGGVDPDGDGWLRLTSTANNEAGSAIYNTAFSNTKGIQVSFLYAIYGGSGADGFTFYLIDGATGSPTVGASGGALGYSWKHEAPDYIPGVTNGYVGIGFDEFGNFTNGTSNNYGTGGFANSVNPDRIGIRGPGNLHDAGGFPYLTSVSMPIETVNRAGAKHVVITITPSPTQTISVTVDGVAQITNYDISGYAMPATFKMGFSSSTGGSTNYHEIRDLTVTGLNPSITGVVTSGSPSVIGNSVTFTATVTGGAPGTPTGNVAFYDGATYLGTGALDGAGVATYATSALTAGDHTITAKYLGDSDYSISQGTVAQSVIVVPPPTITGVTPNAGPTAGGTSVTITGTDLTDGVFTFGGAAASCTVAPDGLSATCTTPSHAAGLVDVVVTTPGGSDTEVGAFTFVPPPTVEGGASGTGVAPRLGILAGGTSVTVTGTGFHGLGTGNATFTFGGVPASCAVTSDTSATCTTPAGAAGVRVDVVATTPYGGTGAVVGDFYYVELSPIIGPTAGGQTVTITGVGFTGATVYFNGLYSARAACTATTDFLLTCVTPARPQGLTDVVIRTPADGDVYLLDGYTYVLAPSFDCCGNGIAPNLGTTLGGDTVTIYGHNLTGGTFAFGGASASCTVNPAGDEAVCTTPPHASGLVDVTVTTIGGTATLKNGYTYNAPPVAVDDTFATFMSVAFNGNVLTNDTDAESDPLTAILVGAPAHASAFTFNANGTFTYEPENGYQGADTFTYMANDGMADSNVATVTINITPRIKRLYSIASDDGWIMKRANNTWAIWEPGPALRMGDQMDQQYRSFISFNTAKALPANYVIVNATVKLYKTDIIGGDPFLTHGRLLADIRKGFFGTLRTLETGDFLFAGTHNSIGNFVAQPAPGWYALILPPANYGDLNLVSGLTQFRLRFAKANNGNGATDYVQFCSGNCTATKKPQLVIEYYIPHP